MQKDDNIESNWSNFIEEDNRAVEKKVLCKIWKQRLTWLKTPGLKVNKRKHLGSSKDNENGNDAKRFKGDYYNCGKSGHQDKDCCYKKKHAQKKKPP